MKLDPSLHAYVWATIASGVAANPHHRQTAEEIAKATDALVAEYEKRRERFFPKGGGMGTGCYTCDRGRPCSEHPERYPKQQTEIGYD